MFSLTLAAVDGTPLPAALPGQFLTFRLRPETAGPPVIRSYSMSGRPGPRATAISVKQEPRGVASGYLRAHLRVGDILDVAAPRGVFTLGPATRRSCWCPPASGPLPSWPCCTRWPPPATRVRCGGCTETRDGTEHPFAQESRDLLARLPNAHEHVFYSRPAPDDRRGVDYETAGRISADLLDDLRVPRVADAYLCGPPAFMHELPAALASAGLTSARIHTEIFGAGPALTPGLTNVAARPVHPPAGPPGPGPAVSFARSGLTVEWDPSYASLLELAEACDVPTRWSCRTGVCHNCESGLLSGAVGYSPEPVEAPAEGDVLICCSQPRDDLVLDL